MADARNRTLYLAGEYPSAVTVNSSFRNGLGCEVGGEYAHAEGSSTSAGAPYSHTEGKNCTTSPDAEGSHASGINADAVHREAFVWNGDGSVNYQSKGDGTFSINPKNGRRGFYIGDESLYVIVKSLEEGVDDVAKQGRDNTFTKVNTFRNVIRLEGSSSQAQFMDGKVTVATPDGSAAEAADTSGALAASLRFVKNFVDEFKTKANNWTGRQIFADARVGTHPDTNSDPFSVADVQFVNNEVNNIRNNYETWVFTLDDGSEVTKRVLIGN